MVAYRSFSAFLRMLKRFDLPGVQLWAVWAIHHVVRGDRLRPTGHNYEQMIKGGLLLCFPLQFVNVSILFGLRLIKSEKFSPWVFTSIFLGPVAILVR